MKEQTWSMGSTSYDKSNEVIAKDILNEHLKQVELRCNPKTYEMDLGVWSSDKHVGFLEIEVAQRGWYNDGWYKLSFLWRKFQNAEKEWCMSNTIYCKFKMDFTDCFAAGMLDIINHSTWSSRCDKNTNLDPRLDTYIEVPKDSPALHYGIEDVSKFIDNYFK